MNLKHFKPTRRTAGLASLLAALVLVLTAAASAQVSFSSGSNGSDGAFDLTGTASGTTVTFLPSNFPGNQHSLGIYNFTYITIPSGVTVRLSSLNLRGPVYWLASGAVSISGTIDISGRAGYPSSQLISGRLRQMDAGAGGFPGGMGGNAADSTSPAGDGPGGGAGITSGNVFNYNNNGKGAFTGTSSLVPLIGGSGGAGGFVFGNPAYMGAGGGSGGGAILIASSTSMTVSGTINATGGATGTVTNGNCNGCGGSGSGGAIHLVANTLAGSGTLNTGGGGSFTNNGVVRLEAYSTTANFSITGTSSSASPGTLILPTQAQPSISVVSVASASLPASPTASVTTPDATINSTTAVTITIQAANIPVGTVVTLHLYTDNNGTDQTVQTTPLAGTFASSTATANVTFPSGYSMNYVKATWTNTY
jgi:hypothetical protein